MACWASTDSLGLHICWVVHVRFSPEHVFGEVSGLLVIRSVKVTLCSTVTSPIVTCLRAAWHKVAKYEGVPSICEYLLWETFRKWKWCDSKRRLLWLGLPLLCVFLQPQYMITSLSNRFFLLSFPPEKTSPHLEQELSTFWFPDFISSNPGADYMFLTFTCFTFLLLSHITAAESHTVFISFFHSKKQFHLLVLNRYFVWQRKLWHILSTPNIDNLHVFPLFHSDFYSYLLASLFISDTVCFLKTKIRKTNPTISIKNGNRNRGLSGLI